MTILIDSRKGSAELAQYITAPTKIAHLEFADFSFLGNGQHCPVSVGIERKSIRDLISSIVSGRLSGHQLIGLSNSYDYSYIVVDGVFKTGKDGLIRVPKGRGEWCVVQLGSQVIPKSMIDNYLNNLLVVCGVFHEFTPSAHQTGAWVTSLYKWWQKPWADHKAHLAFHSDAPKRAMFKKPSLVHRMIKEIDKVGWDKGLAISKKFACMADIVMADKKDIESVRGIGKVLAKRILNDLWGKKQ